MHFRGHPIPDRVVRRRRMLSAECVSGGRAWSVCFERVPRVRPGSACPEGALVGKGRVVVSRRGLGGAIGQRDHVDPASRGGGAAEETSSAIEAWSAARCRLRSRRMTGKTPMRQLGGSEKRRLRGLASEKPWHSELPTTSTLRRLANRDRRMQRGGVGVREGEDAASKTLPCLSRSRRRARRAGRRRAPRAQRGTPGRLGRGW